MQTKYLVEKITYWHNTKSNTYFFSNEYEHDPDATFEQLKAPIVNPKHVFETKEDALEWMKREIDCLNSETEGTGIFYRISEIYGKEF